MKNQDSFTVDMGLEIQAQHLREWQNILKKKVYRKVLEKVLKYNAENKYEDGYSVLRGTGILNIVLNLPEYKDEK